MSRPWMPLYVADYLADTGHLSTVEHGAYMLLIMHYWSRGNLPTDDNRLASIARTTPEQWQGMRSTLAEFFEDGWMHARIDAELDSAAKAYERRAAAGRAGGKAKAEGKPQPSNARALPEQSHSEPHKVSEARASSTDRASEFDAFWSLFPNKVGKRDAGKSFDAARKRADLETILAGLGRYVAKTDDRPWCNPTTWLNQDRWEDQPATVPRQATSPPGKQTPFDAYDSIAKERGWTNEPEILPGADRDAQRPQRAGIGHSGTVVELRRGSDWG